MGTGTSSKSNEEDVRNRLNSGDFQKVTPPSSPNMEQNKDEMSYSGILVEKPESETPSSPQSSPTMSASFAADLTTPPVSNRSKSRTKAASKDQPRRIVKATHPPSSDLVVDFDGNQNDNDSEAPSVHHTPNLASPIGANAATEMLEESIEKNAPKNKNKRLERVSNKQKSDRDKLLQEKRRSQQTDSEKKPQVQANPFSRFLSAFSVNTNPTHKRKDSADVVDQNKRQKYGFTESSTTSTDSSDSDNANSDEADDCDNSQSLPVSWIVAASLATVGILLFAVVRGSKKK